MKLVMFHSGKLPEYLEYTFKQIRLFNPDLEIHFLTDLENCNNPLFKKYKINPWPKITFYSDKVRQFEIYYGDKPFWTIAATRLIYMENFIKTLGLTDVYHFENDVLLYYNLQELHKQFLAKYQSLAITRGGKDKCMTGFMFIKNGEALAKMTQFFIDILCYYGVKGTQKKFGMDMVNEMSLMAVYMDDKNGLEPLPIIPPSDFGSIFDPASWGQFVGGTTEKIPGAKPKDLSVSQMLIANPDWTVDWIKNVEGRKIPYFKGIRINNLHIHSKELHKYMS
jgi:hypothetical protein